MFCSRHIFYKWKTRQSTGLKSTTLQQRMSYRHTVQCNGQLPLQCIHTDKEYRQHTMDPVLIGLKLTGPIMQQGILTPPVTGRAMYIVGRTCLFCICGCSVLPVLFGDCFQNKIYDTLISVKGACKNTNIHTKKLQTHRHTVYIKL